MMGETNFVRLACISVSHARARLHARLAIPPEIPPIWLRAPV